MHCRLYEFEAGGTVDNSFFDNCFELFRQCKNRSFYLLILLHKKSKLDLIELNQENIYVRLMKFPWSKLTLVEHKCCPDLVRLILISTFNFFRLG
jgi:hypothetical protein